jgi:hypothetical protein
VTVTYEVETEPDIVCIRCDRPLPPGAPIGEALEGMTGDRTPIVETVCVYCAMGA